MSNQGSLSLSVKTFSQIGTCLAATLKRNLSQNEPAVWPCSQLGLQAWTYLLISKCKSLLFCLISEFDSI